MYQYCIPGTVSKQRVPEAGVADAGGRGLHDDGQADPQDGHSAPQHPEAEYQGTDRV